MKYYTVKQVWLGYFWSNNMMTLVLDDVTIDEICLLIDSYTNTILFILPTYLP